MGEWAQGGLRSVAVISVLSLPLVAHATDIVTRPDRPVVNASALYLVDLQSGRILLEQNATRRLPLPASQKS